MMQAPTDHPSLLRIARKLVWWKSPRQALADPVDLACRVMTLGTWDDVLTARQLLGDQLFRQALAQPTPGVFDRRSWRYWHLFFGHTHVPALPQRNLP
ncbi:MAG: hypothetical protein IT445_02725 [Phycisphaeraceae bacterium]|nr:hypothetical protein [Phycisphaeraceae bacterium]